MTRLLALCFAFILLGFDPLAAAETVRVRVGAHEPPGKDAFGRIVLEWPAPVDYKATIESGRLVVRFARPVTAQLATVMRSLDDYVSNAMIEDEGRSIAFALKSEFGLKTYADGPTIVLDLIRLSSVNLPAPKPAPAAVAAQAAPKALTALPPPAGGATLAVRSGEHAGFGRLVFDWTRNVEYRVVQEGNRVTIYFDHPAKIDYVGLARRLPKPIGSAEPANVDNGVAIALTLESEGRLRHFRSGTGVVLDVLASGTPDTAKANPAGTNQAIAAPASGATPVAKVGQSIAEKLEAAKPARPAAESAAGSQTTAVSPKTANGTAATATPSIDAALAKIPGLNVAPAASAGRGATPSTPPAEAPVSTPSIAARPAEAAPTMRMSVQPIGTASELTGMRFAWPQEVSAAIYERSGQLWLIFDRRAGVDVVGVWPRGAVKPQSVPSMSHGDVTILRWALPQGKQPGLRRDGKDWVIDLKQDVSKPLTDLKVESHVAVASGGRLLIRDSSFSDPLEWQDPDIGDQVWAVPIKSPGHGSISERRFAEVQVLATLQGLVILPLSDAVTVRRVPEGIEVTKPGGLYLSDNSMLMARTPDQTPISSLDTAPSRLFDFVAWSAPKTVSFFDRRRELQRAVIEASGPSRNRARLAFAQFYFAHGYVTDALGILQVIVEDDADAQKDPAFRALRGASLFLRGDYPEAGSDLFNRILDTERDAALWRGVLLASQGDWITAAKFFNQADRVLTGYPQDFQLRFGLLAAEASLMTEDAALAKFQLEHLSRLKPGRIWRDQIDYLQGRTLAKLNDMDGAIGLWQRAMVGEHRPSKVKARYARTEALLASNRIMPTQAIEEVEKLRYAWRGDEIEMKVLKLLGELYIDTADYRNGLTTLRDAVTNYPQASEAQGIGEKMRSAFSALYLNGDADNLPPLTALSLYDEFRDLTPPGDVGDMIVSKLVDRLVSVDLLDRAAAILKTQIDTRLKGAALADAVNRLSVIHLLARQPENALALLNRRVPPEATPVAINQRRQLLARTLGELTRYKEALALLEGDRTADAERLRAEIGWRTQNWPMAAAAFAKLAPPADQAMTDGDRQTVLRLGIAQALSGNAAGLRDLRQKYSPAMAQSAFKESFELVTAPGIGPTVDLRTITRHFTGVDQFRAFMTSYRDQLLTRKDSAIKPGAPKSNS